MSLNVLHVSESDAGGGAGKSARSLHDGLRAAGVRSRMLVGRRLTDDADVRSLKRSVLWRVADRPFGKIADRTGLQYVFYPSSFGVAADSWFRQADILQLHNLHGSYFGFSALPFLSRRRETVWWIQDMWPVTGHVAYSYDCERWKLGCGACPYLHEYPALSVDRTHALWKLKEAAYRRSRLTIVTSSRWLAGVVAASPLLSRFERRIIPNGVDVSAFRPRPRAAALERFGLGVSGPVLLLFDGEERKGAGLIPELLGRLAAANLPATVLVAGERGRWRAPPSLAVHDLGRITDERTLAAAYAAADLFVLPTLADNLPNSVLESLACGTPVVGFAVGGLPDAVRHLDTGYLAPPRSVGELATGVLRFINDEALLRRAGEAARALVEHEFTQRLQTERFAELYRELAERGRTA